MTERRSKFGPAPIQRDAKVCSICGIEKPLDEFGLDSKRAEGRKRQCKPCLSMYQRQWAADHKDSVRRTRLKKKYNLTPAEYEVIAERQGGCCAICKTELPHHLNSEEDLRDRVGVDHDHVTGRIRGLLCGPCNKALGFFQDDPAIVEGALAYLRQFDHEWSMT